MLTTSRRDDPHIENFPLAMKQMPHARRSIRSLTTAVALACLVAPPSFAAEPAASAAAERLLEATRVEELTESMYGQISQMISGMAPADVTAEEREAMDSAMQKVMALMRERIGYAVLKDDYVRIYADAYTVDDMNALSDFFDTELGQRYLDKTPEVMAASAALAQERMMAVMPELMEVMQSEMEAARGAK